MAIDIVQPPYLVVRATDSTKPARDGDPPVPSIGGGSAIAAKGNCAECTRKTKELDCAKYDEPIPFLEAPSPEERHQAAYDCCF